MVSGPTVIRPQARFDMLTSSIIYSIVRFVYSEISLYKTENKINKHRLHGLTCERRRCDWTQWSRVQNAK